MFAHLFGANSNKAFIIKSLKQSILDIKVNLTTKAKTYYEVLEIPQTATYNEIKSAYYKLSLKYHPDKNKSDLAKVMFQEISNAYDVLSKYDTRRAYDKTLSIQYDTLHHHKQKDRVVKYPPKDRKVRPPTQTIYNFDEWLRCHYSETVNLERDIRTTVITQKVEYVRRDVPLPSEYREPSVLAYTMLLFLTYIIWASRRVIVNEDGKVRK